MTLEDFFHLSEEEFADRISKLSDEELMKDDIHNCRAMHSGAYGAAIGALEAPVTAGMSLVGSAIGLRKRNVAKRRLEIIHAEVIKRGLPSTNRQSETTSFRWASLEWAWAYRSLVDAGIDLGTSATAQVAQEGAGKLAVSMGTENVIENKMPGTGRSKVWVKKLAASRSTSELGSSALSSPETRLAAKALSTPSSPLLEPEDRPPLPPRPLSAIDVLPSTAVPTITIHEESLPTVQSREAAHSPSMPTWQKATSINYRSGGPGLHA